MRTQGDGYPVPGLETNLEADLGGLLSGQQHSGRAASHTH